jgi:hypothetical protein
MRLTVTSLAFFSGAMVFNFLLQVVHLLSSFGMWKGVVELTTLTGQLAPAMIISLLLGDFDAAQLIATSSATALQVADWVLIFRFAVGVAANDPWKCVPAERLRMWTALVAPSVETAVVEDSAVPSPLAATTSRSASAVPLAEPTTPDVLAAPFTSSPAPCACCHGGLRVAAAGDRWMRSTLIWLAASSIGAESVLWCLLWSGCASRSSDFFSLLMWIRGGSGGREKEEMLRKLLWEMDATMWKKADPSSHNVGSFAPARGGAASSCAGGWSCGLSVGELYEAERRSVEATRISAKKHGTAPQLSPASDVFPGCLNVNHRLRIGTLAALSDAADIAPTSVDAGVERDLIRLLHAARVERLQPRIEEQLLAQQLLGSPAPGAAAGAGAASRAPDAATAAAAAAAAAYADELTDEVGSADSFFVGIEEQEGDWGICVDDRELALPPTPASDGGFPVTTVLPRSSFRSSTGRMHTHTAAPPGGFTQRDVPLLSAAAPAFTDSVAVYGCAHDVDVGSSVEGTCVVCEQLSLMSL